MANLPDLPDKVAEKIPTIDQWKKHGSTSVQYIFMLLFVAYFLWNEVLRRDDCASLMAQKDVIIKQLTERVDKLETAYDIERGVNKNVKEHIEPVPAGEGGEK